MSMTEPPTSEDLVRRAKAGDVQAFGILYDRTVRLVRAVAADAGSDHEEDVTHDAYLRAYRNLGKLRDPERFAAWLVGITRLIVRERRRARRFESLPDDVPGTSVTAGSLEGDAEELLRAVARLPEEEQLGDPVFSSSMSGASTRRPGCSTARGRGPTRSCRVRRPNSPVG